MIGRMARFWRALRRARSDENATAIVEFALILPMLMVLYIGGFEASQSISIYRKISDLTTELANLSSRDTHYSKAILDTENGYSAQIMAPYPVSGLSVTTTEIVTDATDPTKATVEGSRMLSNGVNSSPLTKIDPKTNKPTVITGLPSTLATSTAYILIQTSYTYTVVVGGNIVNPIPTLSDQLYILPRSGLKTTCGDCD